MKLTYKAEHLSIKEFNEVTLPDFVVLTGINGSGKSHLLEAIKQGKVGIDDKDDDPIVYFDYRTFFLENESEFDAYQIVSEKESAWNYFLQHLKGPIQSYKNQLGENYSTISKFCRDMSIGILNIDQEDFMDHADMIGGYVRYSEYRKQIKQLFERHDNFKENDQAKAIYVLLKKLHFSIDEIEKDVFIEKYIPYFFKNDFLPRQLGKIIWDYYVRWDDNDYHALKNSHRGKRYKVLTEAEFTAINGEKPWIVINEILNKFGSLKYRVNDPDTLGLDRTDRYKLTLKNLEKDIEVDFNNLSSGEKILMALVASIYKGSSDNHFPKILLLDEIDASLHPSMIKNLIAVINDIFISKATKVILVTHSPTTVAISSEESVYVMEPDGKDRIVKKSKQEALSLLTEGFATLEEGIKLFDEVSKKDITLVTEGNNSKLIEKALELYGESDVDVLKGAEGKSGDTQLKTVFEFFSLVPHNKKVLFVWDCDIPFTLVDKNKTYYFKFPKNEENKIAQKGIENLFPQNIFTDEYLVKIKSADKDETNFNENKKRAFEEMVLKRNQKDDFSNFKSLIEKIVEIKSSTSKPKKAIPVAVTVG